MMKDWRGPSLVASFVNRLISLDIVTFWNNFLKFILLRMLYSLSECLFRFFELEKYTLTMSCPR